MTAPRRTRVRRYDDGLPGPIGRMAFKVAFALVFFGIAGGVVAIKEGKPMIGWPLLLGTIGAATWYAVVQYRTGKSRAASETAREKRRRTR